MSVRIGPTAHYTGHVWYRHGLSEPPLTSCRGRALYTLARPLFSAAGRMMEGVTVEHFLLGRHRRIDQLLTEAIGERGVTQVLELGAGLTPRGVRFTGRHGSRGLRYFEADLPEMASLKRHRLWSGGLTSPGHRVVPLDLLDERGALSLEAVVDRWLDPSEPAALIAEGLLNYLPQATVDGLWARFGACLGRFPAGLLLADIELEVEAGRWAAVRAFMEGLRLFVGGQVEFSFYDEAEARSALGRAGFEAVALHGLAPSLDDRGEPWPPVARVLAGWAR